MIGRVDLEKSVENGRLFKKLLEILNSVFIASQSRAHGTVDTCNRYDSTLQGDVRQSKQGFIARLTE